MAKGSVYIKGLDEILADLDGVIGDVETKAAEALDESLSGIESKMKSNALSTFTDGYTQGVMVNSINHKVTVKDGRVTASVGVYDMSNKTGSTNRRLPEPIIAYMYEFGIQPHSTSSGAKSAKDRKQEIQFHPGSPPRPFLSSAFDSMSDNIFEEIIKKLNSAIDKR